MNTKNQKIEQICFGIEQLAIGFHFFKSYPRKKFPLNRLIDLLEEAHYGMDESESKGIDVAKNYSNYRKALKDSFGIEINFQKKIPKNLNKFESKIPELISIYLKKYSYNYNDKLLHKYIQHQKNLGLLEYSLYTIVFLNLTRMLKAKVEVIYEKIHGNSNPKSYRIIPCGHDAYSNFLSFIVYDLIDNQFKHFALSGIKEIKTDFFQIANETDRGNFHFDYEEFHNSKDFFIQRESISYQIKIREHLLKHFAIKFFPIYKIVKESEDFIIIEIESDKPKSVYRAIFEYGNEIQILSPVESIKEYKKNLSSIIKLYQKF